MGIYIEGMEMPLPGTFNIIYIYSDGQVRMPSWGKGMTPTNGVKAIPIPPHGRLIDADALRDNNSSVIEINSPDGTVLALDVAIIDDAPTVIPASGTEVE